MAAAKKALKVTGAAVVLRTKSGSDRYLYQGATVQTDEFTEASIKHATTNKLISEVAIIDADTAAATNAAKDKAEKTKAVTAAKKAATDAAAALAAAAKERDEIKGKADAKPEDVAAAETKVTEAEKAKADADAAVTTAVEAAK